MELERFMTVEEASERLGRSRQAVRLMAASGDVAAVKRGNAWWLDTRAVEQRHRESPSRGRRLSPQTAWLILLLASGLDAPSAWSAQAPHQLSRARRWLRGHRLVDDFPRLGSRARREQFDVHPAEIGRIAARNDLMLTGISRVDLVGVHGGGEVVEFYAPASARSDLVEHHALVDGRGPVLARWVPDDPWPSVSAPQAPRAAVLVDLLEHDDPRVRREAGRAIERL